jgi:hypothetical protein
MAHNHNHNHDHQPAHFKGKDAVGHVVEAQAQGIIASSEIHGTEVPGHFSAGADAARETALVLLLAWTLFIQPSLPFHYNVVLLAIFTAGWSLWKFGRSAWLGWARLERLHRIVGQEKWEIDHHRQQERSELKELYAAKGFEGKLLEEVLDVLMADDERLLRVMVEEELGLSLQSYEHPLKQGLGALVGSIAAGLICFASLFIHVSHGLLFGSLLVMALSGALSAFLAQNRLVPAVVWNVGLGVVSYGVVYFLMQYFF